MNIYLHELREYRKSTLIWTGSLIAIVVLFMSMFPSFAKEADSFKQMLEGFPPEVLKAFELSVDSITTLLGFFSYSFLYIKLTGAIQAMNLGTSIISKETREKTADFLLTKPVTRTTIVTSKLLAALTSLVITNIGFLAAALLMASVVKTEDYSVEVFLMISATLFFIQLVFLALGVLVSVIFPRIKSVISVSLATVFAFFIIGMIGSTLEDEKLRYFTPFNYFDNTYIVENSSYEWAYIYTGIAVVIIAIAASYVIYIKKDTHSV